MDTLAMAKAAAFRKKTRGAVGAESHRLRGDRSCLT
jgi:hypothetical protein